MPDANPIDRGELFTQLFVEHQKRILGLIYALTQNRGITDDVLQEVSVRLWRKFDSFEEGSNFAAWSLSITRYVVMEWRRANKRVPLAMEDEQLHAIADSYVESAEPITAVRSHLDDCLTKTTDRQRRLLRDHYELGYKIVEIASNWELSRRAIHKLLKKTKDQLLECIEGAQTNASQEGHPS